VKQIIGCIDALNDRVTRAAAWLVVPLFLIMSYEVFARFVLDWSTFWSWELAYMITGAHYVFGIAYVTRKRQHFGLISFIPSSSHAFRMQSMAQCIYSFCCR
jgi:TRAP-type mannitol/chloroaromatic compound transport system permease small subunit